MAVIIDSSVWVALFLDADTQHTRAARILPRIAVPIYAPYCVISETATVIAYKHSKAQADAFLAYIADNRDIVLMEDVLQDETAFFLSIPQKVSFTDTAIILLSKKLKARIITFDRQIERIAKRTV